MNIGGNHLGETTGGYPLGLYKGDPVVSRGESQPREYKVVYMGRKHIVV